MRERPDDETPAQTRARLRPHRISRLRSAVGALGNEILSLENDIHQLERRDNVPKETVDEQRTVARQKWDQIDRLSAELDTLSREEGDAAARRTRQRRGGRIRSHDLKNRTAERIVQRFRAEIGDRIDSDVDVVLASDVRGLAEDIVEPGARKSVERALAMMEGNEKVQGLTVYGKKSVTVILRPDIDPALQAMTLGHELGHVLWQANLWNDLVQETHSHGVVLTQEGKALWSE